MVVEIQQHKKRALISKTVVEQALVSVSIKLHKLPLTPNQRVMVAPPKPKPKVTITKPGVKYSNKPNCQISGHPSAVQTPQQQQHTSCVQQHALQWRRGKMYLKCRIKNCKQAYVTFKTARDLNTHHAIFHKNIVFKCHKCPK